MDDELKVQSLLTELEYILRQRQSEALLASLSHLSLVAMTAIGWVLAGR